MNDTMQPTTKKPTGLTQTEARRRAKELSGLAIEARWSVAKNHWVIGGWASQPGSVWIVVSLDQSTVLLDTSDNPPVTFEQLQQRAEAARARIVKGSRGGYVLKDAQTDVVISRHANLESLEEGINGLDQL